MDLLFVTIFIIAILAAIFSVQRAMKKRNKFSRFINLFKEKEVLYNAHIYEYDSEGESYVNCDVCIVRGGIIAFTIAESYYFFREGFENRTFSHMASKSGAIKTLKLKEDHILVLEVEYKNDYSNSSIVHDLKFKKGKYFLRKLLLDYSMDPDLYN